MVAKLFEGGECMTQLCRLSRSTAILLSLVALLAIAYPARAQNQTVHATIVGPAQTDPVVPRREYVLSNGAINGVNGYVFKLDPLTVGTNFSLQPSPSSAGVGGLSIYFYSDLQNGVVCSENTSGISEAGSICGVYAIVVLVTGADVTFDYQGGLPPPSPPPFVASGFQFTQPLPLLDNSGNAVGNGEPSIALQPGGPIYVTSPSGIPCGLSGSQCVSFWRSTDGGASFTQPAPSEFSTLNPLGGGDSEVIVDHLGRVYVADLLSLTSVSVWHSLDQGNTWLRTITAPCADREWLAPGGPNALFGPNTVYETNHDCNASGLLSFWRSIDGANTFLFASYVASDVSQLGFAADTANGNVEAKVQVDPVTAQIYVLWATAAIQDGTNAQVRIVLLGRSDDGGSTWRNFLVHVGPVGTTVQNLFPVLAVDRAGKVYAAWSSNQDGTFRIYVTASSDQGEHWSTPTIVSPTTQTAVFPAIAAGGNGKVDVIWIGTNSSSPNAPDALWNIYFAQSRKAFASQPKWSVGQITPQVMHTGDICNQGLNCNLFGGNRNLADFISVTVDGEGMANAVWTDDASQPKLGKIIMYGKQTSGPGIGHSGPRF